MKHKSFFAIIVCFIVLSAFFVLSFPSSAASSSFFRTIDPDFVSLSGDEGNSVILPKFVYPVQAFGGVYSDYSQGSASESQGIYSVGRYYSFPNFAPISHNRVSLNRFNIPSASSFLHTVHCRSVLDLMPKSEDRFSLVFSYLNHSFYKSDIESVSSSLRVSISDDDADCVFTGYTATGTVLIPVPVPVGSSIDGYTYKSFDIGSSFIHEITPSALIHPFYLLFERIAQIPEFDFWVSSAPIIISNLDFSLLFRCDGDATASLQFDYISDSIDLPIDIDFTFNQPEPDFTMIAGATLDSVFSAEIYDGVTVGTLVYCILGFGVLFLIGSFIRNA